MLRIAEAVLKCQPNPAHKIIAQWEKEFAQRGGNIVVFTQNIDGYHRLAGSENVLEIHGNLGKLFCTKCEWETREPTTVSPYFDSALKYPKCPNCDAVIRPRIVMFEEMLPRPVLAQFQEEFADGNGFDMVFSIGTSAMFPYITGPVYEAIRCGKTTVEINPVAGELSRRVTYHIPLGAADALTRLDSI
jgi:NAD-dependent deacetylase